MDSFLNQPQVHKSDVWTHENSLGVLPQIPIMYTFVLHFHWLHLTKARYTSHRIVGTPLHSLTSITNQQLHYRFNKVRKSASQQCYLLILCEVGKSQGFLVGKSPAFPQSLSTYHPFILLIFWWAGVLSFQEAHPNDHQICTSYIFLSASTATDSF
jgi:hypothetical protein